MVVSVMSSSSKSQSSCNSIEDENDLRRGPWTVEEDTLLIHSIALHGEGRWNLLAVRSGLRRTGKSCRLRWLNYLKPDVKRGDLSPQEQLLILDLHSRWGNRWSKIAQQLPGRTDNEIKNHWRTRVQKQAKLLNIDANSTKFKDIIRRVWIPRLLQQINESSSFSSPSSSSCCSSLVPNLVQTRSIPQLPDSESPPFPTAQTKCQVPTEEKRCHLTLEKPNIYSEKHELNLDPDQHNTSSCISSSESMNISGMSDPFSDVPSWNHEDRYDFEHRLSAPGDFDYPMVDCHSQLYNWMDSYSDAGCFWNFDELWQF